MAKKPHSDTRKESHLSGRKSSGGCTATCFSDSKRKGSWGDSIPDGMQSTTSFISSSSIVQVGTFPTF